MPKTLGDVLKTLKKRARREGRAREFAALDEHFRYVAYQLEALRVRQGLTQRELARRTGIHQAELSRILSGRTQPRIDTAERIARALGAELRVVRTVKKGRSRTARAPSKASLREMPEVDFERSKVRRNPYARRIAQENRPTGPHGRAKVRSPVRGR